MSRTAREIQDEIDGLEAKRKGLKTQLTVLAAKEHATEGDLQRSERLLAGFDKYTEQIEELREEQRDVIRSLAFNPANRDNGQSQARRTRDERNTEPVISRALQVLDSEGRHLDAAAGDQVDRLLRAGATEQYDPSYVAERLIITENPLYRSAWLRYLAAAQRGMAPSLTAEEAGAMRAYEELEHRWASRSVTEWTGTGGLGVPSLIDPSIIVTSGASDAPLLRICRIEQVTNNVWKGVSSAGMSWSYDTEAAEVSDDTPTLAQPSVTVHMARGFIPYSIEVGMDYPGFASEMSRLLNQGYMDLIAAKTMTGSGTGEPWGIFTALDANTNVEVVTTTDGSFGGEDVFKVWNALPERYRSRATWVMSVHVQSAIRKFAAAATTGSAYFTIDLTGGTFRINDRPVILTDYAPTFASTVPGTTGAANILTVGDFSNYVMANRVGMSVEAVQHVFHTGSNRPSGERGLFAYARHGFDSANDLGFRLLQNQ